MEDGAYLLAGKRRSGKSTLLKDLLLNLTNKFDYSSIILISDTHDIELSGSFSFIKNV